MKYFIDTHDRAKGSYPERELSAEEFVEMYGGFDEACEKEGGVGLGAHVNLDEGKAFCFTTGPDAEAIRRAHEAVGFPFDSITEVKRVTGVDLRPEAACTPKSCEVK